MKFAVAAAVAGTLVVGSPAAGVPLRHIVQTVVSGNVEAAFSYDFANYRYSHPRLTIKRGGQVLVDKMLRPLTRNDTVLPGRYYGEQKSITIRRLDPSTGPDVVLDLYSGGNHCCSYTDVYHYDAKRNSYLVRRHLWGDANYRFADLDGDGLAELVSGDSRFAYAFTSFAFSTWPVQIWHYRAGRFLDVTREFPKVIRRDARHQWSLANTRRNRWNNAGFLAAWAADECLLGHSRSAFTQLETLAREHRIGPGTSRTYLLQLRRFLHRTGYLPK